MVQFQRYDGTTAELNPLWLIMNYRVRAISESDGYILIQDAHGLVASIAKGLFRSNHEDVPSGEFDLHPSLYRHYFSGSVQKRKAVLDAELLRALPDILADPSLQRLVIDTPEYYLIRPEWLRSGVSFGGGSQATLGAMLQAWSSSDELMIHNMNAIRWSNSQPKREQMEVSVSVSDEPNGIRYVPELMLISVRGSAMSGSHSTLAWCTATKEVYVINTSQGCSALPGRVAPTYMKLSNIAKAATPELQRDLPAMERLLKDVGRMT
jgi:hypothetical protein